MDPSRKRKIRLVVALSAAVLLATALIVVSFSAGTSQLLPSEALAQKPTLGSGRVVARFLIGGNGRVLNAGIEATTLNDPSVEACIAEAIHRWDFPKPSDSGVISVSYPFVMHAPGE